MLHKVCCIIVVEFEIPQRFYKESTRAHVRKSAVIFQSTLKNIGLQQLLPCQICCRISAEFQVLQTSHHDFTNSCVLTVTVCTRIKQLVLTNLSSCTLPSRPSVKELASFRPPNRNKIDVVRFLGGPTKGPTPKPRTVQKKHCEPAPKPRAVQRLLFLYVLLVGQRAGGPKPYKFIGFGDIHANPRP